jgi:hypothetical protein
MMMEWGIAFGKNAGLRTCDIAGPRQTCMGRSLKSRARPLDLRLLSLAAISPSSREPTTWRLLCGLSFA